MTTSGSRRGLDWWEAALALALVALFAYLAGMRGTDWNPEGDWLAETYGPQKHSQFEEEWIIRDFFRDGRGGVFVDVGAADARLQSTTYYLERALGWSGIAVDAQVEFAAGYREHRPRTRFFPLFVADQSGQRATLYVTDSPWVATSEKSFTEQWEKVGQRQVPTITLDDLLAQQKIEKVDFLSMDIELSEPKALAGFSIERFRPALVCIEAHPEVRQQILEYFASHGYVLVGKYLRVDEHNLYFMPKGHLVQPFPPDVLRDLRRRLF